MPSRPFVMPRKELGEYDTEPERRRSAPARPSSGMLFPLAEEGGRIDSIFEKAFICFFEIALRDRFLG